MRPPPEVQPDLRLWNQDSNSSRACLLSTKDQDQYRHSAGGVPRSRQKSILWRPRRRQDKQWKTGLETETQVSKTPCLIGIASALRSRRWHLLVITMFELVSPHWKQVCSNWICSTVCRTVSVHGQMSIRPTFSAIWPKVTKLQPLESRDALAPKAPPGEWIHK